MKSSLKLENEFFVNFPFLNQVLNNFIFYLILINPFRFAFYILHVLQTSVLFLNTLLIINFELFKKFLFYFLILPQYNEISWKAKNDACAAKSNLNQNSFNKLKGLQIVFLFYHSNCLILFHKFSITPSFSFD